MATASNNPTNDKTIAEDEYVKSRRENGRFVNSFNPEFKLPGITDALRWIAFEEKNTNLPANLEELDETLPIIKNRPEDILRTTPGVRFIWIGHATCLVQIDDFLLLTDPLFCTQYGARLSKGSKRFRPPALTVDDLPDNLNAVFISHNHFDHLNYESVQSLNHRYGNRLTWYCGLGGRQWFIKSNVESVIELDWWEECKHRGKQHVNIAFCPAQHWSRRTPFDSNKSLWGGYAIWNQNYKFYFTGDTGYTHNIPIFKQIGKKYGPFDLSAIPIGAYAPRWVLEAQHVSPDEAVQIHIDLKSKRSIGIHWGTLAMGNEFYLEPKEKLKKAVENNKLDSQSFTVVKHGELFDLP